MNNYRALARTLTGDDLDYRKDDNLEVRDDPALSDVFKVALDHAVKIGRIAVRHLPPAGDAWLHGQALQVVLGVLLNLARQRRARAHHAHLAQEHVEELRELVDGVLTYELPDPGDAGVLLHLEHGAGDLVLLLELRQALVGVLVHGAELPHAEGRQAAVAVGLSHSDLAVEGVALTLYADGRGKHKAGYGYDGQHAAAEHDVKGALNGAVGQARTIPVHDGLHGLVTADALVSVHGLSNERRPHGRIRCILSFIRHVLFQHFVPWSGILPVLCSDRPQLGNRLFKVSRYTLLGRKHGKTNARSHASTAKVELQISSVFASVNGFDKAFVAQQWTCRHYDLITVFRASLMGTTRSPLCVKLPISWTSSFASGTN